VVRMLCKEVKGCRGRYVGLWWGFRGFWEVCGVGVEWVEEVGV